MAQYTHLGSGKIDDWTYRFPRRGMTAGGSFQTGGYGEYRVGGRRRGTGQIAGHGYHYGQPKKGTKGAKSTVHQAYSTTGAARRIPSGKPRFGQYPTLTSQQQTILSQLMKGGLRGGMGGRQAAISPVRVPRMGGMPGAVAPTYAPAALGGAEERAGALSRMMAVSPQEEQTAIERMSAPAMRQFREDILPGIRGTAGATGTLWSTMRAGEEAKAGAGLAEGLASMGEQYRLQRRGQAMEAAGLSAQEALGAGQLGQARYATEMQPYMQARELGAQAGMQTQRLGVQAGLQAQQLGVQRGGQREQMLAQLLGIPMMGVYSYPGGGGTTMSYRGGRSYTGRRPGGRTGGGGQRITGGPVLPRY